MIVTLGEHKLEEVESFTYLVSLVTVTGGADEDVKARIGKAIYVVNLLKPVWRAKALSVNKKLRIFNVIL